MLRQIQSGIQSQQFSCRRAGVPQDRSIPEYISQPELQSTALPHAEKVAGPPQFQVFSRNIKTVVGLVQNLQARADLLIRVSCAKIQ